MAATTAAIYNTEKKNWGPDHTVLGIKNWEFLLFVALVHTQNDLKNSMKNYIFKKEEVCFLYLCVENKHRTMSNNKN